MKEHVVLVLVRHIALCSCGRLFAVFEELGGVGAAEQVDRPVGEYLRPVEVVAELVEIDALPDERTNPTASLCAQDVDEGTAFPKIHELAQGAVTEGHGCL